MLAYNMNKLVMFISTFSMSFLIEETQLQNYLEVFDFGFFVFIRDSNSIVLSSNKLKSFNLLLIFEMDLLY